jgi:hypothetical protein
VASPLSLSPREIGDPASHDVLLNSTVYDVRLPRFRGDDNTPSREFPMQIVNRDAMLD